jgi:uncharacterized protein
LLGKLLGEIPLRSNVYFADLQAGWKKSVPKKVAELFELLKPTELIGRRDLVAIKLHFGEAGGTAYIRPQYVRTIVERLKTLHAQPFLTDTNTLYVGSRAHACSHLATAFDHGFTREVTGAPLIISDGLKGNNKVDVPANHRHVKTAHIGADIHNADALIVLTHFKGHELSAFGGTLKNLGMGCASREGKLEQHSNISPKVDRRKCVGCGECTVWCRGRAIKLEEEADTKTRKARITPENCVGCAECILACPQQAIRVQWNQSLPVFMEKMVEYAAAVLERKKGKTGFMTFVTDVSPLCDCTPFSDRPIVPDLGILASLDPVAIDQAAVDLVNGAPGNPASVLRGALAPGEDKFRALYPEVDWEYQLKYAEEIGLGTRDYTLVNLSELS